MLRSVQIFAYVENTAYLCNRKTETKGFASVLCLLTYNTEGKITTLQCCACNRVQAYFLVWVRFYVCRKQHNGGYCNPLW